MALIGNWGDFTFYVSADQIKTFDSLKWDSRREVIPPTTDTYGNPCWNSPGQTLKR